MRGEGARGNKRMKVEENFYRQEWRTPIASISRLQKDKSRIEPLYRTRLQEEEKSYSKHKLPKVSRPVHTRKHCLETMFPVQTSVIVIPAVSVAVAAVGSYLHHSVFILLLHSSLVTSQCWG